MARSNNWKFVLAELVVVFSGVYLAFLLNRYQESERYHKEQIRILTAIKYELEEFRLFMPGQAEYMRTKIKEWNTYEGTDSFPSFYSWRFIEPQYDYHVIEYALNQESSEIIDLRLYENLSKIYNKIRRLEHAERRMTVFSDEFELMPTNVEKNGESYQFLFWKNKMSFYKFRMAAVDRAEIKQDLGETSAEVVKVVNQYFDENELRVVEKKIVSRFFAGETINSEAAKDAMVKQVITAFPRISEAEARQLLEEASATK